MPDIAGAEAAIEAHLAANWTTTPIVLCNESPAEPFPPTDVSGHLAPWVLLEIDAGMVPYPHGIGIPGDQTWRYTGEIEVHVMVPHGDGRSTARTHAVAIGEIFRNATLYSATPGYEVRCMGPSLVSGGRQQNDDFTAYYRRTVIIPFEYWHRG